MISKTDNNFVTGLNAKYEETTFSHTCCFPMRQFLLMYAMWIDIIHIIDIIRSKFSYNMMSYHKANSHGRWMFSAVLCMDTLVFIF